MTYLNELNPAQREAVEQTAGPLLVVAGAGAGKTKTIAYRILHLINQGVEPSKILAITFTNKAAGEMRERVLGLLQKHLPPGELVAPAQRPFISTFHSLGVYLLREYASLVGLTKRFSIVDQEDALGVIKKILKDFELDPERFPPKKIHYIISQEKNRLNTPSRYQETAGPGPLPPVVTKIWQEYAARLQAQGGVDFDDLLLKTNQLLSSQSEVLADCRARWQYLHIDEYQDTNHAQYRLAKLLVGSARHLCVVGDTDQAIYGWRGADFTNLLKFEEDYPEAKIVLLTENYRSTKNILAAANSIIEKNLVRHPKTLITQNQSGEKISLITGLTETDEALAVAQQCAQLLKDGVAAAEIAVLYRTNFQSRVLEEAMLKTGLPYKVVGTRFFERKEIKDLTAFLKLALNQNDTASLVRVINVPPRGIGKVSLAKIVTQQTASLPKAAQTAWQNFQTQLTAIAESAAVLPVSKLIGLTIKITGLKEYLEHGTEDDRDRLANIYELISVAEKYDGSIGPDAVWQFLTDTAVTAHDDIQNTLAGNGIQLMTVHAAKGLEFSQVFITGLEAGLFPHHAHDDDDPEEERRLFYVALTRAKHKLYLCYAQSRMLFGSRQTTLPSEFLLEIDPELLDNKALGSGYPDINW